MNNNKKNQVSLCEKLETYFLETSPDSKVGISRNVKTGKYPINGLRHKPSGNTSGWYIWHGEEIDHAEDFFLPFHAKHLNNLCPIVEKFLGLPPGWRFLIAQNYEDVWFDESIIDK